jgi:hypothetical protein
MKKILNLSLLLLACSGCATAYNSTRMELFEDGKKVAVIKERSWITSMASKSNANKAKAGGIELQRSSTEAQPEVVEAIVKGAVKGAVGR